MDQGQFLPFSASTSREDADKSNIMHSTAATANANSVGDLTKDTSVFVGRPGSNSSDMNGNAGLDEEDKPAKPIPKEASRAVPGTTLRCLEDPSFQFDQNPTMNNVPLSNVRNDPMSTGFYDMSTSSETNRGQGHESGGRPQPSEVLEGAREKFDKFWSGKK